MAGTRHMRWLTNKKPGRSCAGLTILEVMMATVILTIVAPIFIQFLVAGDKVRGRALTLDRAAMLARNEAERIKSASGLEEPLADSSYEESCGGALFTVERSVVERDEENLPAYLQKTQELRIVVKRAGTDSALVSLRLIQGGCP
jgi:Tfp pilus assembly protein PilV